MTEVVRTPDARYVIVRGRLWRAANPHLPTDLRERLVQDLMRARRAVKTALGHDDAAALAQARANVDRIKQALGERGEPWWDDGAPDYNRRLARNTPYAHWYADQVGHAVDAPDAARDNPEPG